MVTLAIGSAPIGALIVGAVADTFGVAAAIGGASGICLIIVGAIAARFGMFGRNLVAPPHRPGDPEPVITHAPADSPIAPPESITVDDPSPARATV
jgi:hypothetical protein